MDRDRGHYAWDYSPRRDPSMLYNLKVRIFRGPNADMRILSKYYASVNVVERKEWGDSTRDVCRLFISLNGPGKGKAEKKARNAAYRFIGEASKSASVDVKPLEEEASS
jgi:hypothetical protein